MSVLKIGKRVSWLVLASLLGLSICFVAWASTFGDYAGNTEVWGITDISGYFEVFCNRETIFLDVRNLEVQSVTWSDLGNEADGIAVRTIGDGSVVADFTLPGG